jgi:hypothetical protein
MGFLEQKPEPFRAGALALSAEALNKLVRTALREIRGGQSTDVSYYGDRVTIKSTEVNPQLDDVTNYLAQFVVLQEYADYLLCVPFTQPTNDDGWLPQVYNASLNPNPLMPVYVAKPYLLQQTPWSGQTVEVNGESILYTYTGVGVRLANVISQQISPNYFPGDVILAVRTLTGYSSPNGNGPITWMDLNLGARIWFSTITYVSSVCDSFTLVSGVEVVTKITVQYTTQNLITGYSSIQCVDNPNNCCSLACTTLSAYEYVCVTLSGFTALPGHGSSTCAGMNGTWLTTKASVNVWELIPWGASCMGGGFVPPGGNSYIQVGCSLSGIALTFGLYDSESANSVTYNVSLPTGSPPQVSGTFVTPDWWFVTSGGDICCQGGGETINYTLTWTNYPTCGGSGTGGSGGTCSVTSTALGDGASGNGTGVISPVTITGVVVASGSRLAIAITTPGYNDFSGMTVKWNGISLALDAAITQSSGVTYQSGLSIWSLKVTSGATANIVVTGAGGFTQILFEIIEINSLPINAVDESSVAWGLVTQPSVGPMGPTATACEFIWAVFALETNGTLPTSGTWNTPFSNGGQDVSNTLATYQFVQTEGYYQATAIGTFTAQLNSSVQGSWLGAMVAYK